MNVHGYSACGNPWCDLLVLDSIAAATGGICPDCWNSESSDRRHQLDIVIEGRTARVASKPARTAENRSKERWRRNNPQWKAKKTKIHMARRRALRRLAAIHPAEYLVLLADERARVGMDPWPVVKAFEFQDACRKTGEDPSETLNRLATYHAGDAALEVLATPPEPRNRTA